MVDCPSYPRSLKRQKPRGFRIRGFVFHLLCPEALSDEDFEAVMLELVAGAAATNNRITNIFQLITGTPREIYQQKYQHHIFVY